MRNAKPDTVARKNAARRVANRPERALVNRAANLKYNYGLTVEQHDKLLADQGGVCAICGEAPDPNGVRASSRLHVDHDHVTRRVRGLLCTRCNQGLGYFRDRADLLLAASQYV